MGDQLENEMEIVMAAKNDEKSFEWLYEHYFPRIYGYIFKRVGNQTITEDLVSEIFLKVFTNLQKYQNKQLPFSAWIYKIATNTLIDHYRRKSRRKEEGLESAVSIKAPNDQKREIEKQEEAIQINQIINQLPKKYQEILLLKFFAEFSITEISLTMNITENNVRVLSHRALAKFKKHLNISK